jgi:hypothetical protein
MTKHLFIFLIIAVIVSSCGMPNAAAPTLKPPSTSTPKIQLTDKPFPIVTPVCISSKPTQEDMKRALYYIGDIFNTPDWVQSNAIPENSAAVTWQNSAQGAVVYLEILIFPCGYEEPDLNKYFSNENWKAVFANYDSYEPIGECKTDTGLRLYEFNTHNQGFDYSIKYWVKNDTDTHVIVTMIVFPLEERLLLDEYSSKLFPDYSTCP